MKKLLQKLTHDFPEVAFSPGKTFCWSPATAQVFFDTKASSRAANWSLLHETSHALLHHTAYRLDFELLQLEVAAWQKAKELGQRYNISIDQNHIEDCLDTYRDWLHRRSICPACGVQCLQQDAAGAYQCHNCRTAWKVASSRFCRPYRLGQGQQTAHEVIFG